LFFLESDDHELRTEENSVKCKSTTTELPTLRLTGKHQLFVIHMQFILSINFILTFWQSAGLTITDEILCQLCPKCENYAERFVKNICMHIWTSLNLCQVYICRSHRFCMLVANCLNKGLKTEIFINYI